MTLAQLIEWIAVSIAYMGVAIVLVGVLVTVIRLAHFLFTGLNEERSRILRHSLMMYLSLGLDFLIAKDVIVTLSLESSDFEGLLQLVAVIFVRILLSYFVHLEEGVLRMPGKTKSPIRRARAGKK